MSCDLTDLNQRLSEAKSALHQLAIGKKVQIVQFGTNRRTEYTKTNQKELERYIAYLENMIRKCSTGRGRQPIYLSGRC